MLRTGSENQPNIPTQTGTRETRQKTSITAGSLSTAHYRYRTHNERFFKASLKRWSTSHSAKHPLESPDSAWWRGRGQRSGVTQGVGGEEGGKKKRRDAYQNDAKLKYSELYRCGICAKIRASSVPRLILLSFSKNNQSAIVAAVALSVRDNGITLWERDGGRAGSLLSQISHLSLTFRVKQPPFQVVHNFDRG